MDVFSLLSYINKFSLLAFFITTVVVGYQLYNLKKEKINDQKPIIPDFDDNKQSKITANYTRLPSFLTQKNTGVANYSKLIFFIILLLTVIIIVIILVLVKKRNSSVQSLPDKILLNKTKLVVTKVSPTVAIFSPTVIPTVIPLITISSKPSEKPTPRPTEIILAKAPTITPTVTSGYLSPTHQIPKTLPETGSIEKALLIIGVAVSTIFFSFWL